MCQKNFCTLLPTNHLPAQCLPTYQSAHMPLPRESHSAATGKGRKNEALKGGKRGTRTQLKETEPCLLELLFYGSCPHPLRHW